MARFLKVYAVTTSVFLVLDFLWLGLLMSEFYQSQLGTLARRSGDSLAPVWWPAVLVYLIIPASLILFVVPKARTGSTLSALFWGFAFGAILYGVYDFTNYSTLDHWPLRLALVDTAWGGTVSALSAVVAVFATDMSRISGRN